MASMIELIKRGKSLAEKYSEEELKSALVNAIADADHEERLALQYALKTKTNTSNGYSFTKEAQENIKTKLSV